MCRHACNLRFTPGMQLYSMATTLTITMRGEEDRITTAMRDNCLVERWRPASGGDGKTVAHAHATWQVTVAMGGETRLGLTRGESVRPVRHVCIVPPGVSHFIADNRSRPAGVRWFALYVPDCLMREAAQRAWGYSAWPFFDALVHEVRSDMDALMELNASLLAGEDDSCAAEQLRETLARLLYSRARPAPVCARRDHRLRLLQTIANHCGKDREVGGESIQPFAGDRFVSARDVAPQQESPSLVLEPIGASRSSRHRAWQALELPPPGLLRRSGQIDFAKRLLAAGETPSHVATDAGFYDQPHLTRQMRSYAMCTPGRFGNHETDVQDRGCASRR